MMETFLQETLRFGVAFVVLGIFVWVAWVIRRHYKTGSFPIRMSHMMRHLGIATNTIEALHYEAHLPTAVRLCEACTTKAECDSWLAGRPGAADPPKFCPNVQYLRLIAKQGDSVT